MKTDSPLETPQNDLYTTDNQLINKELAAHDLIKIDPSEEQKAFQKYAERKEILKKYLYLLRAASPLIKGREDIKRIRMAFDLALDAHGEVRRKSGEPYIYHPIEVARIAIEEIGLGVTSIICALLHDVVEDTEYKLEYIEERFGRPIARIIDGLTKIKSVNANPNGSEQADNYRKMLLAITEDIRVMLVKIADRLHNMRTLDSMSREKQLKIKSETEFIYAPIAHRLGLYSIKSELEDLCLRYSHREAYEDILKKLEESRLARERFISHFVAPIDLNLKKLDYPFRIKSRLKSIASIYSKMKKQGVPFDDVYDLFAIRIIIDVPYEQEKEACWKIYSAITDLYTPDPKRLRDWISMPKASYESLHTTVMSKEGKWVEVQIRTERMDEIAEKGVAADWKYKAKGQLDHIDNNIEQWMQQVREVLENQNLTALEAVNEFKSNLFNKEVYVFTPKGDLRVMPSGSTVLDFAFDIHTEIGAKCMGAKVNQKLVPFDYTLTNGDQIEILASSKIKINDGWLKFVETAKARNKIRDYLKNDEKKMILIGKEITERKLKQLKLSMNNEVINQLVQYFGMKSESDFFTSVGKGIIDHTEIKKFKDANESKALEPKRISFRDAKDFKDSKKNQKSSTQIDEVVIGEDIDLLYTLSQCCSPVPGDDIFGMTSLTRGIRVHRTNCPNATNLMASYGNRIIKARWSSDKKKLFEMSFKIFGTDRIGLVNDITQMISMMKVNINAISFATKNGVFEGEIALSVHDVNEGENIVHLLEKIEGIVGVNRYEI